MAGLNALDFISKYESDGNPTAQNPTSSASGLYQFINSTWRSYASKIGVDTSVYPTAKSAPADVQTAVAAEAFNTEGFAPWASNLKLMTAVQKAGGADAFGKIVGALIPGGGVNNLIDGIGGQEGLGGGGGEKPSALSRILGALAGFMTRAGVGVLGIVLIAIGAWAVARGGGASDAGVKTDRAFKRVIA